MANKKQLADFQNPDGTYNGAALLSHMSGISEEEVRWQFARIGELLKSGLTKEEAKKQVVAEARIKFGGTHGAQEKTR